MNWVGGARNRVRFQNERNAQKEFFERKKLGVSHTKMNSLLTPCLKKNSVSQDLLALQTINHVYSKAKTADTAKKPVRKLDLEGFRSTVTGRKFKQVELPASPQETPSMLDLMEKGFHKSNQSKPKSETLFHQKDRDLNTQFGLNSRTKFSSLISPRKSAGSSVPRLPENSLQHSIIPEKIFSSPQKDCNNKFKTSCGFGLNPFLFENSTVPKNTMKSCLIDSTGSNVKPNSRMKSRQDVEGETHYLKPDSKSNKLLDSKLHNQWVLEDFQTTPLIKYNRDEFQDDMFCTSYKPVDSKPLRLTSPFYKPFHEDTVFKNPIELQFQDRNTSCQLKDKNTPYCGSCKVGLDKPEIYKKHWIVNEEFACNELPRKDGIFINELTSFIRTPSHESGLEKPSKVTLDPSGLDESKYLDRLSSFETTFSLNPEKEFTCSDSECILNKRRKTKNITEIERINSTNNEDHMEMKNLWHVKQSGSFDNLYEMYKLRPSKNVSSPCVPSDKYCDKNNKILQQCEKLKTNCFSDNISKPVKPSPLSTQQDCIKPLPEVKNKHIQDVVDDENNILVCTKEEYDKHRNSRDSAIDEVLDELIQLDHEEVEIQNTCLSSSNAVHNAVTTNCLKCYSVNVDGPKKNKLSEMNQLPAGYDEEQCIINVLETLVREVIMQENNTEILTNMPDHLWTKPNEMKKSLNVINSVFRKSKIAVEGKYDLHGVSSEKSNMEMFGMLQNKKLNENEVTVQNEMLHDRFKDYAEKNDYYKSVVTEADSLFKHQRKCLEPSPASMFVQTYGRRLVDASTSPIHSTTVDIGVQWETPESSQDIFISADTQPEDDKCGTEDNAHGIQPEDDTENLLDMEVMVEIFSMNLEYADKKWLVKDKCLDSQSQPKEQTYTLRPRKK